VGIQTGTQVLAEEPSELKAEVTAAAMGLTSAAASCPTGSTADVCRDLILDHLVGLTNADNQSRCTASGCRLFGAIYHSVPTAVPGRPSELLRDESYEGFVRAMATIARPSVLYTSTVDGFLHAFDLAPFPGSTNAASQQVATKRNNELWAFIPPAVLPVLHTQYPKTPMVLLDGVPIIKDVVATVDGTTVRSYDRLETDAENGTGSWRTVLVQGFGDGSQVGGGYFAIDITDPRRQGTGSKPVFRWQLTRDSDGKALFGSGGTPLITTVFLGAVDDPGGPREVPVAVLPGGDGPSEAGEADADGEIMPADPATFTTTRTPRKYRETNDAERGARSLTIVRLDTGEIVRTFRPEFSRTLFEASVFTMVPIPAPITGQPKAFPDTTGAVADRIYVGDRDGRLWRVDVSSQDPSLWTMKVFYDAFEDGNTASSQPVILPPVLSVDDVGDVTIAFATGSQNLDTSENRVISLTEQLKENNEFAAHVNWIHELEAGDRVTGPMVLFNRGLYYSVSRPPETTGSACDVGRSKVYGTNYIESADFEDARANGDDPDPTTGPAPAPNQASLVIASQPGLVFGLSLEAEPTCASEEETVTSNDSFGYGEVRTSRTVKPGKYYLTFDASGNNSPAGSRGVLEVREELESPRLPVTFSSWAAVYE
jgi:type IV pilus assembly protein PilY1